MACLLPRGKLLSLIGAQEIPSPSSVRGAACGALLAGDLHGASVERRSRQWEERILSGAGAVADGGQGGCAGFPGQLAGGLSWAYEQHCEHPRPVSWPLGGRGEWSVLLFRLQWGAEAVFTLTAAECVGQAGIALLRLGEAFGREPAPVRGWGGGGENRWGNRPVLLAPSPAPRLFQSGGRARPPFPGDAFGVPALWGWGRMASCTGRAVGMHRWEQDVSSTSQPGGKSLLLQLGQPPRGPAQVDPTPPPDIPLPEGRDGDF
ncbi:dehydrogenase/reductase SDR family member 7 [Platysternon megacephalum]|uniref:Dehydrogenase/reductase SDR family member 7 n=1 Tax=Platysternon megacephalum TaxID=55544 RepID=A0A4D9EJY1_9SAUR|nr:dehydrogenase/reductase SDR family member 7 [Platysternon megacephalum]